MRLPPKWILLLIVFVEGFAVLAAELLAMRQVIPYVGSGTDTISIIIAAVLLPLAIGNFMGGRFKGGRVIKTVRAKLIINVLIAMAFLTIGLSYPTLKGFFEELLFRGLENRHALTTLYALLFLIVPIYLMGQTLPLISHYFSKDDLQKTTGKMLFFSTTGSFMGSVFCTLVLMATIGVHYTVAVVISALGLLVFILNKKLLHPTSALSLALIAGVFTLNNITILKMNNVVSNNQYHLVQIEDEGGALALKLNGNISSKVTDNEHKQLSYINYINEVFFNPIRHSAIKKDILVIGAGGFMLGGNDTSNNITYIDIDAELLPIAEEELGLGKLSPNKTFEAVPARAFLTKALQNGQRFDLIVVDVFQGKMTLPEHLVTREFYAQVYDALKPGGIMAGNYFLSPNFSDKLSRTLDSTLRSVFGNLNRQVLPLYSSWDENPSLYRNVIYSAYKFDERGESIYTDTLNSSFYDKTSSSKN